MSEARKQAVEALFRVHGGTREGAEELLDAIVAAVREEVEAELRELGVLQDRQP